MANRDELLALYVAAHAANKPSEDVCDMPEPDPSQDSLRDMIEETRRNSRKALNWLERLDRDLKDHDNLLFRGTATQPGLAVRVGIAERDIELMKQKENKFWGEMWKLVMAAIIGAGAALASQFGWHSTNKP